MGKGTRATGKNLAKFRCGQSRLSQSVSQRKDSLIASLSFVFPDRAGIQLKASFFDIK